MGPKAARPAGGSRIRKEGQPDVYRIGGQDVPCDPELAVDRPRPQPLFPVKWLLLLQATIAKYRSEIRTQPPKAPHCEREDPNRSLQIAPREHT